MPIASFTGSAQLASWKLPAGGAITAFTVGGSAATYTVASDGTPTVTAPAVTATSAIVITYNDRIVELAEPVSVQGTVPVSGGITNTPATPSTYSLNSAANTNAAVVKAAAGTTYDLELFNAGASDAFVKLYNKASAPTVGTDVPLIAYKVPAGGNITTDFGPIGLRFTTGIAIAVTGAAADTDTTAVAASQVKVAMAYI